MKKKAPIKSKTKAAAKPKAPARRSVKPSQAKLSKASIIEETEAEYYGSPQFFADQAAALKKYAAEAAPRLNKQQIRAIQAAEASITSKSRFATKKKGIKQELSAEEKQANVIKKGKAAGSIVKNEKLNKRGPQVDEILSAGFEWATNRLISYFLDKGNLSRLYVFNERISIDDPAEAEQEAGAIIGAFIKAKVNEGRKASDVFFKVSFNPFTGSMFIDWAGEAEEESEEIDI